MTDFSQLIFYLAKKYTGILIEKKDILSYKSLCCISSLDTKDNGGPVGQFGVT